MKLLNTDGKVTTWMHDEDGKTYIGTHEDVTDIVDLTKDRRAHGADTSPVLGHHVASIPLTTIDAWAKKISGGALNFSHVVDDEALFDRFMAEHGAFQVRGGWQ